MVCCPLPVSAALPGCRISSPRAFGFAAQTCACQRSSAPRYRTGAGPARARPGSSSHGRLPGPCAGISSPPLPGTVTGRNLPICPVKDPGLPQTRSVSQTPLPLSFAGGGAWLRPSQAWVPQCTRQSEKLPRELPAGRPEICHLYSNLPALRSQRRAGAGLGFLAVFSLTSLCCSAEEKAPKPFIVAVSICAQNSGARRGGPHNAAFLPEVPAGDSPFRPVYWPGKRPLCPWRGGLGLGRGSARRCPGAESERGAWSCRSAQVTCRGFQPGGSFLVRRLDAAGLRVQNGSDWDCFLLALPSQTLALETSKEQQETGVANPLPSWELAALPNPLPAKERGRSCPRSPASLGGEDSPPCVQPQTPQRLKRGGERTLSTLASERDPDLSALGRRVTPRAETAPPAQVLCAGSCC
nr:uncharacterized protein LOC116834882 [Chelonoidis abingdonii]